MKRESIPKPAVFAGMVEIIGNAEKIDVVESILSTSNEKTRVCVRLKSS